MQKEVFGYRELLFWSVAVIVQIACGAIMTMAGFGLKWLMLATALFTFGGALAASAGMFAEKCKTSAFTLVVVLANLVALIMVPITILCADIEDPVYIESFWFGFPTILPLVVFGGWLGRECVDEPKRHWGNVDVFCVGLSFAAVGIVAYIVGMFPVAIAAVAGAVVAFASMALIDKVEARKDSSSQEANESRRFNPERPLSPANPNLLAAFIGCGAGFVLGLVGFMFADMASHTAICWLEFSTFLLLGIFFIARLFTSDKDNEGESRKTRPVEVVDVLSVALSEANILMRLGGDLPATELAIDSLVIPLVLLASILVAHGVGALMIRKGSRVGALPVLGSSKSGVFGRRKANAAVGKTVAELEKMQAEALAKSAKLGKWSGRGSFKAQEKRINGQWERAVHLRCIIAGLTSERFGENGITKDTYREVVEPLINCILANCEAAGRFSAGFLSDDIVLGALESAKEDIEKLISQNDEMLASLEKLAAHFRSDEVEQMGKRAANGSGCYGVLSSGENSTSPL